MCVWGGGGGGGASLAATRHKIQCPQVLVCVQLSQFVRVCQPFAQLQGLPESAKSGYCHA